MVTAKKPAAPFLRPPTYTSGAAETTLAWSVPASAKPILRYYLYRTASAETVVNVGLVNSFVDEGLTSKPYTYQVAASSAAGLGARSNQVEVLLDPPGCFGIAVDSSGQGNDGYYSWAFDWRPALGVPGLVAGDYAIETGAPGDGPAYAALVVDEVFDFSGDFSIEMWLQFASGFADVDMTGHYVICRNPGNTDEVFVSCTTWANGLVLWFHCNGGSIRPEAFIPADDAPHHLVAVIEADMPYLYLDGVALTPTFVSEPTARGTGPWGADFRGGGATRNEILDEVAFYEHALSAGDVTAHYAARTNFATYTAAVLADNPAGYYHLNETCPPV